MYGQLISLKRSEFDIYPDQYIRCVKYCVAYNRKKGFLLKDFAQNGKSVDAQLLIFSTRMGQIES